MTIKEVKEFFIRHATVSSGAKRDRETTYSKQYNQGELVSKFKMLLKGDYPAESMFKKLLDSITFKLNTEDTAFEQQQGLVQKATDQKAYDRNSSDNGLFEKDESLSGVQALSQDVVIGDKLNRYLTTTNFTTATRPHQLPEVTLTDQPVPDGYTDEVGVSEIIFNGLGLTVIKRKIGNLFRRNFRLRVAVKNQIVIDSDQRIRTDGYTGTLQVVKGVTWTGTNVSVTFWNLQYVDGVLTNVT